MKVPLFLLLTLLTASQFIDREIFIKEEKNEVRSTRTFYQSTNVGRIMSIPSAKLKSTESKAFPRKTDEKNSLDGPTISGNNLVNGGAVESYTVLWEQWDNTYEGYANVNWEVSGGYVISSDKHSITIQWNTPSGLANIYGNISVSEDLGGQTGLLSVTVANNTESQSEFCSGTLGPPAVTIDFGSGSNPGPPLPAGTTTYLYNSSCAINPGEYTIVNNSVSCRSHWQNIPEDHTPNDVNGYFLMVDANTHRDEFFRTYVSGLHPSLKYEFSAWVANLSNIGDNPQIRFEVYDPNGTLLGTSGTNTILYDNVFQWRKIGFMFDLPATATAVQVVIVNTSPNPSGDGNDVVIDDISFAPCYPPIVASFASNRMLDKEHTCNNGTVNLYSSWPSTIPFQNPGFQWQRSVNGSGIWTDIPGATGMSYTQTENAPGTILYRIMSYETSNPSQNVISNSLTYYVQQMIVDARTTNVYSCAGDPTHEMIGAFFHMENSDPADLLSYDFAWSPSPYTSGNNLAPVIIVDLPGRPAPDPAGPPSVPLNFNFSLTVTNKEYGCSATSTQTIAQISPRKVYVPNAFTPVLHGSSQQVPNSLFRPINAQDYPGAKFSVYNRFGERIFYSEGPTLLNYSWDGSFNGIDQEATTYAWLVQLPACYTNIFSGSGGDGVPYGTVILIR